MSPIIVLTIIIALAYVFQIILGMRQLKHFNEVYHELRQKGRVAIGRRSGKIKSGTIVMFAIDSSGIILDARKMQGVTVGAHFKELPQYVNQDLHYLDHYHPTVRQENKLTQIAIEDARNVFLTIDAGTYTERRQQNLIADTKNNIKLLVTHLKSQVTKQ
ncbi:transcriptional regulator GutM [Streptococcus pluranimalium]|uniref:Glucitol operon activator protein n=1 Tax=Streptococcus acidominimus TaxID=1326 RepID=A0A239XLR4_STRAI|nr:MULTISPECIES: transcriptional regulator GutM [Streptococcus]SNV47300.1 glucitol operon activator protein [Streptococcus acidominimus]